MYTCPACSTVLKSAQPLAVGTSIKCPKCGKPFKVGGPKTSGIRTNPSMPGAAPGPRKSAVKKKSGKTLYIILGLVGAFAFFCITSVGLGGFLAVRWVKAKRDQVVAKIEEMEQKDLLKTPEWAPGDKDKPPVKDLPKGKFDTSHIPADFNGALVIRPGRILKSPLLESITDKSKLLDMFTQQTDVGLDKIDSILLLMEPFPGDNGIRDVATWSEHDNRIGRFTARFPNQTKMTAKMDANRNLTHSVTSAGLTTYDVSWTDYPGAEVDPKVRLEGAASALATMTKAKKEITMAGQPGLELVLETTNQNVPVVVQHRIIVVKNRLYQLIVSSAKELEDPEKAKAFFASFKLQDANAPLKPPKFTPRMIPSGNGNVAVYPAGIVRFTEPVDGKKILAKLLGQTREVKHENKTYVVSFVKQMPGAFIAGFVADDRTLLIAPETTLQHMLDAPASSSPLIDRLRNVEANHDVTGIFVMGAYRPIIAELTRKSQASLPPAFGAVTTLHERILSATMTMDVTGDNLMQLNIEANNADSSLLIHNLVKGGLELAKGSYAAERDKLPKDMPADLAKSMQLTADQVMDNLKITQDGNRVVVSLGKPAETENFVKLINREIVNEMNAAPVPPKPVVPVPIRPRPPIRPKTPIRKK